ncbi:MAG: 3-oxoacyl-ACP reductase [Rhodobacterales bacterium 32-66-7]|nr:MAG: 3-oxoacyl-ACP reductase [Rhodobacterales bacterium 12-65-15]OYX26808.1 MAG: 3-oxoacyl-ACP reductase [Rhodobacterales bacterium 32-66-7]
MTPMFDDLKGKSVFITGGGSGIGAALTEAFLRQGAQVAFCQRSDGTEFCDQMEAATGNRPLFLPCDISVTDQLQLTLATAAEAQGPIAVLVNNAANDERHNTLTTDAAFWDQSMAVNLRSYFFAAQSVIPDMQASGGGSIINFSSISCMMADTGYAAYITANAGIIGLTRTLAREFGPDRIRVNAIAPGWVLTERQKELWVTPESLAAHLSRQCLPDPIEPADMAGAVLFLASAASRMMTSQTLILDGGYISS